MSDGQWYKSLLNSENFGVVVAYGPGLYLAKNKDELDEEYSLFKGYEEDAKKAFNFKWNGEIDGKFCIYKGREAKVTKIKSEDIVDTEVFNQLEILRKKLEEVIELKEKL